MEPTGIIRIEADGFSRWLKQEHRFTIRWPQIDRIIAYKDDLFAYDLICLGFFIDGDASRYLCVDEHMDGWPELLRQLDDRFRMPEDWHNQIMVPTFERCERTLWTRAAAT